MSDEPKVARRTKAEVGEAVVEKVMKLSPEKLIVCLLMVILIYQMWTSSEERKTMFRLQQDGNASMLREYNAQSELMRQHCDSKEEKNREAINRLADAIDKLSKKP